MRQLWSRYEMARYTRPALGQAGTASSVSACGRFANQRILVTAPGGGGFMLLE
jgi:hypothetical protein